MELVVRILIDMVCCWFVFFWFVVVTLVESNWIDWLNIELSNCVAAQLCARRIVVARSGGAEAAAQNCFSPKKYENYSGRFPEGVQKEETQQ